MTNQKLRKRPFIAMSAKFKEMGGQIYLDAEKVKESNPLLWGELTELSGAV